MIVDFISYVFTIFGGILFFIGLITKALMQNKVVKPDCPQDVADVSRNKTWSKWLLIVSIIMIIIGAFTWIFIK